MTKAAAPLPRHPTPCSSMKLALFTVLSFGIVGKCLLEAAFGGRKSKPPWTPGFLQARLFWSCGRARARQLFRKSRDMKRCWLWQPWMCQGGRCFECHRRQLWAARGVEGGLQLPTLPMPILQGGGMLCSHRQEENAWDRLRTPALTG